MTKIIFFVSTNIICLIGNLCFFNTAKISSLDCFKLFETNSNLLTWFKDSKVVDESGNPLKVYHTTDKDFDKFDMSKSYDSGFWFTSSLDKINKHPLKHPKSY